MDPDQRQSLRLLWRAPEGDEECRAGIDRDGALVVWWYTLEVDGAWVYDQGAKVPKQGLALLVELLLNEI